MKFLVLFFAALSLLVTTLWLSDVGHASSKKSANEKKLNGSFSMSLFTDLRRFEDEEKSSSTNFQLGASYTLDSFNSLRLGLMGSKQLTQGRDETLNNTRISWNRAGIAQWGRVSVSGTATVVYPTNKDAKVRDEMLAGVELSPTVVTKINDKMSLVYIPRVIRNFHKYKTNRINSTNTEYQVMQIASLTYQFNDKLSLSPMLIYFDSWSYYGTQQDDGYMTQLEVNYNYSTKLQIGAGIMNSGAVYTTEMGPDQSIELYDENSSSIYTNLTLAF